jgi:hypothetical protein
MRDREIAFAGYGEVKGPMPIDGGDAEAHLQKEGTAAFAKPWNGLMFRMASNRGRP